MRNTCPELEVRLVAYTEHSSTPDVQSKHVALYSHIHYPAGRKYVQVISGVCVGHFAVIHTLQAGAMLHNFNFDLCFFPPMAHAKILEATARERALTCISTHKS